MWRLPQEVLGGFLVGVDRHPAERFENGRHEIADAAVVALIVSGHDVTEPGVIAPIRCLPRLLRAQRRIGLGHTRQPLQDEAELDGHRLLAPQRAVVVEDGDARGWLDEVRRAVGGDALDKPSNGADSWTIHPRRKMLRHHRPQRNSAKKYDAIDMVTVVIASGTG
jgi:hypothetical protein